MFTEASKLEACDQVNDQYDTPHGNTIDSVSANRVINEIFNCSNVFIFNI